MPTRITPLDVKTYANTEIFRLGEKIYENELVKHRFQTDYGLRASVRSKGNYHVEMIVENEQLFGRCTCPAGSTPCEHKVAILLAWQNEPSSFTSYQNLRKAIREKEKRTLVEVLVNLSEIFPELSGFFLHDSIDDELMAIREDVADIFDFPHTEKINPLEIVEPCKILFVRAKYLRHENKWQHARILMFEILNRILALVDQNQLLQPFQENFIMDIADDYEEIVLADQEFEKIKKEIAQEVKELLNHETAEKHGVYLDQLKSRLDMN